MKQDELEGPSPGSVDPELVQLAFREARNLIRAMEGTAVLRLRVRVQGWKLRSPAATRPSVSHRLPRLSRPRASQGSSPFWRPWLGCSTGHRRREHARLLRSATRS
jgi:hypothetical protein